jgi:hypothetical protein
MPHFRTNRRVIIGRRHDLGKAPSSARRRQTRARRGFATALVARTCCGGNFEPSLGLLMQTASRPDRLSCVTPFAIHHRQWTPIVRHRVAEFAEGNAEWAGA